MNKIACIVPTRDDHHRLRLVLEGFALQGRHEVHVVDDGSEQDAWPIINTYKRRLDLHYHYLGPKGAKNRRSAIRNHGIRAARADRLLFIDGDCVPSRGLIAAHAAYGDEPIAVLGTRRMVPLHRVARLRPKHMSALPTLGNWEREYRVDIPEFMAAAGKRVPLNRIWSITCHISYPGRMLAAIGGFWEAFNCWGLEDNELGLRMSRAGCDCVPRPDLNVYHLNHPTNHKGNGRRDLMADTKQSGVIVRGPDLWAPTSTCYNSPHEIMDGECVEVSLSTAV